MLHNKKGQSTVEYVLMATAVIAVIVGLVVAPDSPFRSKVNETFNQAITDMDVMSGRLSDTYYP
jgi:Flp pilus assembly pilin Flp